MTGANGFVGKAICQQIILSGSNVTSVVKKQKNIIDNGGQLQIVRDINSSTDWSNCFGKVDVVIHLAARVHVMNGGQ